MSKLTTKIINVLNNEKIADSGKLADIRKLVEEAICLEPVKGTKKDKRLSVIKTLIKDMQKQASKCTFEGTYSALSHVLHHDGDTYSYVSDSHILIRFKDTPVPDDMIEDNEMTERCKNMMENIVNNGKIVDVSYTDIVHACKMKKKYIVVDKETGLAFVAKTLKKLCDFFKCDVLSLRLSTQENKRLAECTFDNGEKFIVTSLSNPVKE